MATEQPVRDLAGAQVMKKNHDQLKAEIDARDEAFASVEQAAHMMREGGHYAGDEVLNGTNRRHLINASKLHLLGNVLVISYIVILLIVL